MIFIVLRGIISSERDKIWSAQPCALGVIAVRGRVLVSHGSVSRKHLLESIENQPHESKKVLFSFTLFLQWSLFSFFFKCFIIPLCLQTRMHTSDGSFTLGLSLCIACENMIFTGQCFLKNSRCFCTRRIVTVDFYVFGRSREVCAHFRWNYCVVRCHVLVEIYASWKSA